MSMQVAVLGNGQLGAMLQAAGRRIGIEVTPMDIEHGSMPAPQAIVTTEREHWPVNPFTSALQQHPHWLNARAYAALVDRRHQKQMLDLIGVPTSPWLAPQPHTSQADIHAALGPDVFLKRASGGYDGRGQQRLRHEVAVALEDWAHMAIAERAVRFEAEVSLVAARNRAGEIVCYRLVENHHHQGILLATLSLEGHYAQLQAEAEAHMRKVMEHLDYVGVMAIEFFVEDGRLLVNEIAPRVHNSGHWTQAGAAISQFELHLRAVCDLPLPQPEQYGNTLMLNLIGLPYDVRWLAQGSSQLHWYGKTCFDGRKMGHLNFFSQQRATLAHSLSQVELPARYQSARDWVAARLA
ncbi:ATP-grasp domain-containing protein [Massilia sp. TS11]|uniref:ATP-grasp domain-containing protein n=1 Tax=Massilia sp. TS11 TaxID=2908003 RepID=UPI001EDBFC17|nr:ATP-grasp domain-containing protein [Massilia sp. TS11]MCG2585145.1 ATP-grasp domain-containing protein [Massilia sp. TS11]